MNGKVRIVVVDRETAVEQGRLLRQLRRSAAATLDDVQSRSKVSKRRLAMAESGATPLTPGEWRRVAKSLRKMIANRITEGLHALETLST